MGRKKKTTVSDAEAEAEGAGAIPSAIAGAVEGKSLYERSRIRVRQFTLKLWFSGSKYYLVDSGYANTDRVFCTLPMRVLRNVVEKTFGTLKKRFKILNHATPFSYNVQCLIAMACHVTEILLMWTLTIRGLLQLKAMIQDVDVCFTETGLCVVVDFRLEWSLLKTIVVMANNIT
ncbi:hypothetical protein ACMD2_15946 [Ananas comosus]|uniref:DDE Tnp4 domain-containing protein n=1 Tax=Ananas comosus TaxID=4615 RepID=A0A199VT11_ANACO|nr:hypothetical protein ACMD2_15946 [Ananas comosus]